MKLGLVGLGRMGANMTRRLLRDDHTVLVTDLDADAVAEVEREGARGAPDLEALVGALEPPRVVWLMVPAGEATEGLVSAALAQLEAGDILVDGANSDWRDSRRRAERAAAHDVAYVDAGVSGGVWGLEVGYNLMVGGPDDAVAHLEPALATLAPEDGYRHVGPAGSGHFVKMIHNGIEYAMLQSIGEGFEALRAYPHADLDLAGIAELWTHGSVIRSWLLELTADALHREPGLESTRGYVDDSGMGRWTLEFAIDQAVAMPAIADALFARFRSRKDDVFADKVIAALRHEFGGHAVKSDDAVRSPGAEAGSGADAGPSADAEGAA